MIGHPAKQMESSTVLFECLCDDRIESKTILRRRENVLAVIAPPGDVIEPTWNVQTGMTRHPCLSCSLEKAAYKRL
jgi:hypothetical protein